jgi:hypothetical protein
MTNEQLLIRQVLWKVKDTNLEGALEDKIQIVFYGDSLRAIAVR